MGSVKSKAEAWLAEMKVSHPAAFALAEKTAMNESGEVNIKTFVMLGFGAIIVAAFIPMGINSLATADITNFSTTEIALYSIIGVAILIAVVMVFVNLAS